MDAGLAAIRIDFLGQLHQQCLMWSSKLNFTDFELFDETVEPCGKTWFILDMPWKYEKKYISIDTRKVFWSLRPAAAPRGTLQRYPTAPSANSTLTAAPRGTSNQAPKRRHATLLIFEVRNPIASLSGFKKKNPTSSDPKLWLIQPATLMAWGWRQDIASRLHWWPGNTQGGVQNWRCPEITSNKYWQWYSHVSLRVFSETWKSKKKQKVHESNQSWYILGDLGMEPHVSGKLSPPFDASIPFLAGVLPQFCCPISWDLINHQTCSN